jgi:1-acyl-sn-glycerol-3-phosphate acyltransferase
VDGHEQTAGPYLPLALRLARQIFRAIAHWPLGWRLELVGIEHLPRDAAGRPAGGWIAAGLPHVTWVEPFLLFALLPPEPRLVWLGDERAIHRSRLRRLAFRRLGGVIPISPGGGPRAFAAHVAGARRVLATGAIVVIFPEVGPPVPPGQARRLSPGLGYLALRTGAPIVPLVCGGTDELFLGRRMRLQVLPSVTAAALAGVSPGPPPPPGSREEREMAHRAAVALHEQTAAVVASAHLAARPRRGQRRRWGWLTHLLR